MCYPIELDPSNLIVFSKTFSGGLANHRTPASESRKIQSACPDVFDATCARRAHPCVASGRAAVSQRRVGLEPRGSSRPCARPQLVGARHKTRQSHTSLSEGDGDTWPTYQGDLGLLRPRQVEERQAAGARSGRRWRLHLHADGQGQRRGAQGVASLGAVAPTTKVGRVVGRIGGQQAAKRPAASDLRHADSRRGPQARAEAVGRGKGPRGGRPQEPGGAPQRGAAAVREAMRSLRLPLLPRRLLLLRRGRCVVVVVVVVADVARPALRHGS